MRRVALVACGDPGRLARAMARHFAHKVDVEEDGTVIRVRIPAGDFELEPQGDALAVRASAGDAEGLARVEEVAASHLVRFGRLDPGAVRFAEEPA